MGYDQFGRPIPDTFTDNRSNWQPPNAAVASTPPQIPRYQIAAVDGEKGVDDFPMGPNSSIILADRTKKDRLWFCATDDLGFKKKRPITYHYDDEEDALSLDDFSKRLKRLEDKVNEFVNIRSNKSKSAAGNAE